MSEKIYKSPNYLFIFRVHATDEQIIKYVDNAEKRRVRILSLLGCSDTIDYKAIYIIDESDQENLQSGKGNSKCIHIFIQNINDIMEDNNLIIHEETHFLLYNICPQISLFLNEGIAEYMCWELTQKNIPKEFIENIGYIKEISAEMILSNTNWLRNYSKQGIWIYGIAYLYTKCILSDKYTVIELLDNIYRDNKVELINEALNECIKMYGG